MAPTRADRIAGALFGTAIGDALGLYVEGLSAEKIKLRFGTVDRYLWPGGIGLLSDDTEQSALVGETLVHYWDDPDAFEAYFRWQMVKWFWTLPPGVGRATAQACLAMTIGLNKTNTRSAGNGAAMRASIIGAYFSDNSQARKTFGYRAARVTHGNYEAIDGALYVGEVAAACCNAEVYEREEIIQQGVNSTPFPSVHDVVERAYDLALSKSTTTLEAAKELGCSGYVSHTIGIVTFCFLRYGDDPKKALTEIISCGGDTDSNAAVLGAWLGLLHGKSGLPQEWIKPIMQGPVNLHRLSAALVSEGTTYGGFNYFIGLVRNVLLIPYTLLCALWRFTY